MTAKTLELVAGYEVHPAAAVFPDMEEDEYQALVEDIRERGQIVPAVTHEGKLLDGRNRLRACEELGIAAIVRPWNGDGGSPTGYVAAVNLKRRNLTASQRAAIAAELLPMFEAEARERQRQAGGDRRSPAATAVSQLAQSDEPGSESPQRAAADAAKATGSSPRSVARAKAVREKAPDLHEKVKAGKQSVSGAEKEARARNPKPPPKKAPGRTASKSEIRQAQAIAEGVSAIAATMTRAGVVNAASARKFRACVGPILRGRFDKQSAHVAAMLTALAEQA